MRKRNEVQGAKNAVFNYKIGAAARRWGYEQLGQTVQYGNDALGLHVMETHSTSRLLQAINDVTDSYTTINFMDGDKYWKPLVLPITPDMDTQIQWTDALDQCFVVGRSSSLNTYMPMLNIDSQLNVSPSRNVYTAPRSKYIANFQGKLVAINCNVNGVTYPNRFYVSSAPTGAITFIQNPQEGLLWQLHVDSVRYIKPGMTLDVFTAGTNANQATVTVVSVDKRANNFSFSPTQIKVADRDEVWLTAKKGTTQPLSYLWNTDYPTPESADWFQLPTGEDEIPEFTGYSLNNNRLLLYTKNSTWKWDGSNLIQISNQVGCVSHETAKVISNWSIWLHSTGIWGYNDMFGQLKLLSRSVQNYILAINQINLPRASAGVVGRVYKVSVGEIGVLDASTTSTSTSSTSTSSTSSSTSSTSTSSTSISSTSSSVSTFSTSTSSTSTSTTITTTTSTSTSVSSTSSSTSTSSTTTTTALNTRQITRLCYDFDLNIWWTETHTREIRYQVNYTMNGYTKPYFADDTGKVMRDETTNTDAGDTIPFEVEVGRNNFGTEQVKNLIGCYVETQGARGAQILLAVEGGQYQVVGEINTNNQQVVYPGTLKTGRDVSIKIAHNNAADRPVLVGISNYFSQLESILGGSTGGIHG